MRQKKTRTQNLQKSTTRLTPVTTGQWSKRLLSPSEKVNEIKRNHTIVEIGGKTPLNFFNLKNWLSFSWNFSLLFLFFLFFRLIYLFLLSFLIFVFSFSIFCLLFSLNPLSVLSLFLSTTFSVFSFINHLSSSLPYLCLIQFFEFPLH